MTSVKTVRIIFGSTSGNTELTSEKVAEVLCASAINVEVKRVERSQASDLSGVNLLILASSTYGHGVLQEDFAAFIEGLDGFSFDGQKCAVIGLGDPKYDREYHIESAKLLEKFVKEYGGEMIYPPLRISKSPVPHMETRVAKWAEELAKLIV